MSWLVLLLLIVLAVGIGLLVWWGYREGFDTNDITVKLARKGCPQLHLPVMAEINKKHAIPEQELRTDIPLEYLTKSSKDSRRDIVLVTLSVGKRPFKKYTLKSLQDYAEKQGYTYIERNEPFEIPDKIHTKGIKDANWQKLFWIQQLLNTTNAEYIVWVDDDILVTNDSIPLEALIESDPDKSFYIGHDMHVSGFMFPFRAYLNSGVFIVKNNAFGHSIINSAVASYYSHEGWYWAPFNDQTAIEYIYFMSNGTGFSVLPHGVLQTIHNSGKWEPGQFICHLAGQNTETRLKNCKALVSSGNVPAFKKLDLQ